MVTAVPAFPPELTFHVSTLLGSRGGRGPGEEGTFCGSMASQTVRLAGAVGSATSPLQPFWGPSC